jgi:hypothetical protein
MILIAVGHAALADSLRFLLEHEGYIPLICDEVTLNQMLLEDVACLILDQDVFMRLSRSGFVADGLPVILMVASKTRQILERAKAAHITSILEKPLLGTTILDEITRLGLGVQGRGVEPPN